MSPANQTAGRRRLSEGEAKAFRMGVLEGITQALDSGVFCDRCANRVELLRISIAARGIDARVPEFWLDRGGE